MFSSNLLSSKIGLRGQLNLKCHKFHLPSYCGKLGQTMRCKQGFQILAALHNTKPGIAFNVLNTTCLHILTLLITMNTFFISFRI